MRVSRLNEVKRSRRIIKEENSIECHWNILEEAVLESAKTETGYKKGIAANKLWVSDEMIRKVDERRKWKNMATNKAKKSINS